MLKVYHDKEPDISKILSFYSSVGYRGGVTKKDEVFSAYQGPALIGVGKICYLSGVMLLRGMFIEKNFQGRGIGTRMLEIMSEVVQKKPCFCIPFDHLEPFFGRKGFNRVPLKNVPDFIQKRAEAYWANGAKIVLLGKNIEEPMSQETKAPAEAGTDTPFHLKLSDIFPG